MSATLQSFASGGPDVLGELLHSLSQPLTSLRCSLELSIDEVAEKQRTSVSVALQQTENIIGMIQLMREYLDSEQPSRATYSTAFAPAVRSVIEGLSSIAAVRGCRLRLVGTCTGILPIAESRLRLALQYLIVAIIESDSEAQAEAQAGGGRVTFLLSDGPAGAVLRAESERNRARIGSIITSASPAVLTLRRIRMSIAGRVLETAGASLIFSSGGGFVLRIPRF